MTRPPRSARDRRLRAVRFIADLLDAAALFALLFIALCIF